MNNATLMYVINDKSLRLESQPLFLVDKYTCGFKNDNDFINNYYNKDKIYKFISDNNNKIGKLVVSYARGYNAKESLTPLYDTDNKFVSNDNPYEGVYTEVEKARRLLFNSKGQLFTRLILSSNLFGDMMENLIDLTLKEKECLDFYDIDSLYINGVYYATFRSLLQFRIKTYRLGYLRGAYEDMIDSIKADIFKMNNNDFYFYNRQLRILINKYNSLLNTFFVKNLKINSIVIGETYKINKHNLKYM